MLSYIHGREARPASRGWNFCKTMFQTVIFWGTFLFLVPWVLFALEYAAGFTHWQFDSPAGRWVGGTLFVLGGALGLTCGTVMALVGRGTPLPADCARQLVVCGPYRFIRNPMAVAGLSQGLAVGIFLGSPLVVAYALVGGPIWHVFVRPWEEEDLEKRFGENYQRYRATVRCWVPRFPGYRPTEHAMKEVGATPSVSNLPPRGRADHAKRPR